jgi:hypothetical protein
MHARRVQKLRGKKILRVEAGPGAAPPGRNVPRSVLSAAVLFANEGDKAQLNEIVCHR